MLTLIRHIFAKKSPIPPLPPAMLSPDDAQAQLSRLVPLRNERSGRADTANVMAKGEMNGAANAAINGDMNAGTNSKSMLCREAMLDRQQGIAGYAFGLQDRMQSRFKDKRAMVHRLYDEVLIRSFCNLNVDQLLGKRLAFIDLSPSSLALEKLDALASAKTVLMIDPPDDYAVDITELTRQLKHLKDLGFSLGWIIQDEDLIWHEVLPQLDFLRIVTPTLDGLQISQLVSEIRKACTSIPGAGNVQIIGVDIITADDFHLCYRAGLDFFHGPFVNSRQNWTPPKSSIDRVHVMQILNQLRAGAENETLAEALMQDPMLSFKMLRYVNSAAMGLQKEVTSMQQALLILGREKFYRWLSLLLFDVMQAGFTEKNLIEQALVRARLMEQSAIAIQAEGIHPDHLFLTGLFSLLNLMLGQTVEQVLAQITVPAEVSLALLTQSGPFAPYLALAIACEEGQPAAMENAAHECGIDIDVVNRELLLALTWANELSA